MAGQHLDAQDDAAKGDVRHGRIGDVAFLFLFADDDLDAGKERRQPGRGGDHHREDDADHEEAAEHVGDAADQCRWPRQAQDACEGVEAEAGQGDLQRAEPAVGDLEGQDPEEDAEGIEGRVLGVSEKRHAGEKVGIPERELARLQAGPHEAFPGVVLQDEIAEQLVVGRLDPQLGGEAAPRLPGVEVVGGQQRALAGEHRREPEQRDQQEDQDGDGFGAQLVGHEIVELQWEGEGPSLISGATRGNDGGVAAPRRARRLRA